MHSLRRWGPLVFALVLSSVPGAAAGTPTFGSVVAIGGSASDIALDESRGVLYIANFGASVIDVMSTATNSIQAQINVAPWPGAIALSGDSQYLLVAHYCNGQTSPACTNAITSIHLADNSRQVFSLATAPLGLAFLNNGQALVITTTNFLLLNPATGVTQVADTVANVSQSLPVPFATFPGQILQASLAASADGNTIWGIASAGTSSQLLFQYSGVTNVISASIYTSSPTFLPRISTSADGSYGMVGYALIGAGGVLKGRYPDVITSTNITGNVIDSANHLVYAQFPDSNQSTGPATFSPGSATQSAMLIMDSDNLTFRDRISIPENMVGRAVLNAAATVLYAASESGVMILPIGSLNSTPRLATSKEDLLVTTNFCNSAVLTQSLTITDPGGGHTDFAVTSSQPGVSVLPASGTTPANVQVFIDPAVIPGSGGTTVVTLNLTSRTAVNHPKPVRVLINNPDPSQHGAIVNVPGILSDIIPDQTRNRLYVLRQDMNQLQVFDGLSMSLMATLRTATSPTMMAMTIDQNFLLVGHDDSQYVNVYDLNNLVPLAPVVMPGGHFGRSIAISNAAILVLARNEGNSPAGMIDSISLDTRRAAPLPSLGIFRNDVSPSGILASSPSGANILYASPEGNVALYTASANTFVNSRHDFTSLSGAVAASDLGSYVIGNSVLNGSLVPEGVVSPSALVTSGFSFIGQEGFMASTASAASAGSMVHVSLQSNLTSPALVAASPIITSEAPLLAVTATAPSPAFSSTWGTYGSGSNSNHALTNFSRTVAPLPNVGTIVVLSTSGLSFLAASYPGTGVPSVTGIISAADGSKPVAPGGLVSIYGQNMSPLSIAAGSTPLSTGLANSCIGLNGTPIPLLYVSPQQINAQLPFNAAGNATLAIHTPAGISNNFALTIQATAPSVFMGGAAGAQTGLPLIFRNDNGQLITPTNPLHPKDAVTIYLTGMGQTAPGIPAGQTAPSSPLSRASVPPVVTLGGAGIPVSYAGLAPGEIGVYQINATVPSGVSVGLAVPLVISQGETAATFNVRVVN